MYKAVASAAAALMLAASSHATIYKFDWNGSVFDTQLNTATSDIKVGDTASASFLFDDSSAVIASTAYQPVTTIYRITLTNYSFRVGSQSWFAPLVTDSYLYIFDNSFTQDGFSFDVHRSNPLWNTETEAVGPITARASTTLDNVASLDGLPDQRLSLFLGSGDAQENIFANVRATVTVISSTPEPASWMMMILGFGLIGAAMRRRTLAVSFT